MKPNPKKTILDKLNPSVCSRFWEKVNKNGPIPRHQPELGHCWEWKACVTGSYGRFSIGTHKKQKHFPAHRISWVIKFGEIPRGFLVLHKCDYRLCVNPSHLFLGDTADNSKDMARKGRAVHGRLHHNAKINEQVALEIHRLIVSDVPIMEIAEKFSIDRVSVDNIKFGKTWAHATGVNDSNRPAKIKLVGSKTSSAVLDENQVIEIRKLITRKFSNPVIAAKFSVNANTISAIRNRRSWKHI